MDNLQQPRIKNRKNKTWLHSHRAEILMMWQRGETLQTIAERLEQSATLNGKKVSKQLISSYLLRYPPEPTSRTVEPEIKPVPTMAKTPPSVVTIERRPQTPVTQSEPVENSETVEEVKPVNPFVKLRKLGKDKPFRDPDEDRYL